MKSLLQNVEVKTPMKDKAIKTFSCSKLTLQFVRLFLFVFLGSQANPNVKLITTETA